MNVFRPRLITALFAMLVVSIGSASRADSMFSGKVTYVGIAFGSGGGGEMQLHLDSGLTLVQTDMNGYWLSSCLEHNEGIGSSTQYYGIINESGTPANPISYSVNGGVAGQTGPSGDPLSGGTAWLYTHFRAGDLNTIVAGFTYNDTPSATSLQNAIWYLEDEIANPVGDSLAQALLAAAAPHMNDSLGSVRVLNIYGLNSSGDGPNLNDLRQDQLVLVGDHPFVPLPSAAWGGGMLLAGMIAWALRRRLA